VHHYTGTHGHYATVTVRGTRLSKTKEASWSANNFLLKFKPRGKKIKFTSKWDLLADDPLSSI